MQQTRASCSWRTPFTGALFRPRRCPPILGLRTLPYERSYNCSLQKQRLTFHPGCRFLQELLSQVDHFSLETVNRRILNVEDQGHILLRVPVFWPSEEMDLTAVIIDNSFYLNNELMPPRLGKLVVAI